MTIEKILLLEEDPATCQKMATALSHHPIELTTPSDMPAALSLLTHQSYDLIFLSMPKNPAIEFIKRIKQQHPHTLCVFLTTMQGIEGAMEAIRAGAFNYLIKPFSKHTVDALLEHAEEHAALIQENHLLRQEITVHQCDKKEQIIAQSSVMKQMLQDIAKIAKSNASVFISGESGTGKEVIAHAIHYQSHRAHGPFVKVNCAAIPESLIESEFFGHEKGAFTGAINKRIGRFELADKGTLLLDEISEIPLTLQSKLLRAVQEQEFERIGGMKPINVDVRFISTSNRIMKEAIEQKLFREDLYYRLNVVPIYLSPLRERKEDILPLAEYFLERLCLENQKPRKQLSQKAQNKLLDYPWPGNIRELANIIERTIVLNQAELILPQHLGLDPCIPTFAASTATQGLTLKEVEKRHILETLQAHQNNRTHAAKALGISIRTLRNKLHEYAV